MCPREAIPVNKPTHVVRTNVFDALGFSPSEASTLKIKSELLSAILEEVKIKGYTLSRLTDVLDEYQPVVRNILRGRVSLVSIERLLRYAHRLHLQTSIAVGPIDCGRRRSSRRKNQKGRRAARMLVAV